METFVEILKVVFLGIVEGITEWLPISSTGHMILVNEFIKLNVSAEFFEMFEVVIQLGAIMAVVVLYFNKLNPFAPKKTAMEKKDTWTLWFKVIVAVLPAGVIGVLFDDIIDELFYNSVTVAVTLILYGVLFIVIEGRNRKRDAASVIEGKKGRTIAIDSFDRLDYKTALLIGLFQVLALIPGTSRSGATIIGAMLLGCSRFISAEFTFFLAIPVMFGASLLKILKFGFAFTSYELLILILGMVVAFGVSVLAIKFLMGYIKKNDFTVFGWYRIVLGVLVLAYFMLPKVI